MIGFYDSGSGGKRIAEIFGTMSNQPYILYRDTGALPLGDKTPEQIQAFVIAGIERLFAQGCTIVVLACNTASVSTIRYIQSTWLPAHYPGKQVLGVTVPLREYMDTYPELKSRKGLLLATEATIQTGFYQEYLKSFGYTIQYLSCPGLADSIEQDLMSENNQFSQSRNILIALAKHIDNHSAYIILACTHYGYTQTQIQHIFGIDIIIDPSQYIAERLVDYLSRHPEYI
jgi:glutamate racemase